MTFDDFIQKYLGKKVDWDGAYGGQCVDLFRQYLHDVLAQPQPRGVQGAADFWTNYESDSNLHTYFDKVPNTPTGVPKKGDIVLWNKNEGGGFGHVSIFIEGNTMNFTTLDQNWPTLDKVTKTDHIYRNVLGWFTLKKDEPPTSSPDNNMTEQQKKDVESMNTLRKYNGVWYEAPDIIRDWEDRGKVISKQAEDLLTLEGKLDDVTGRLEETQQECENKERLRKKWYDLYQAEKEISIKAKEQAAHFQKQCTEARKTSYEHMTIKQLVLEVLKRYLG